MTPPPCPPLESLWLSVQEKDAAALAHVEGCTSCRALLAAHDALERTLYAQPLPSPPVSATESVLAALATQPPPGSQQLRQTLAIFAVTTAVGTALGALSGSTFIDVGGWLRDGRLALSVMSAATAALQAEAAAPLWIVSGLAALLSAAWLGRVRAFESSEHPS